ncbi:MAG: hypothetical protein AB2L07_03550 [Thermoanaerobaculaceae bacterium]
MKRLLTMITLLFTAGASWAASGEEKVLRDLGPDKKIGLCEFRVRGIAGANTANVFGVWGVIYDENKKASDTPYAEEMAKEFHRIYQEMLAGTGAFQTTPTEGLHGASNGKPLPMKEAAVANELFACVGADSIVSVALGWKKKIIVKTDWKIVGAPGWELEISTKAVPESPQSMFPDPADPQFKPILLRLARDSATEFLTKLAEMMKKGGCTTELRIVAQSEPPAATASTPEATPGDAAPPFASPSSAGTPAPAQTPAPSRAPGI